MVDPRSSQFWQAAVQGGLVSASKLEACWAEIPPEKRTADAVDRRLARQSVNAGLLTLWQAQQILAGRQAGLRIDRYVILDQIGHGGMGRVYLARDSRLGRRVAIKVLSRERVGNPRAVSRFRREARLGAQLQHENLIRVYDEGDLGGMPYLVMEYIAGRTVAQLVSERGRLPPGEAAELTRQVALGLEHLHQKDLLHRDVNPANILVDASGTAKLTDLGLAIDLADAEDIVTRDGATVGTFDYISPEQARNPRQVDTRSDIYSLGCTLYHMLAGRVPFPAPSLPEKLLAHQSTVPERLPALAPDVPEGLDAVVRQMLAKRPEERFQRPAEVARALEPFARRGRRMDDAPGGPAPPAGPPPSQLAPAGSDADIPPLIATPVPSADGPAPPPSFDWGQLDLGPPPPNSRSVSRSRSGDEPSQRRWWRLAALVLLALLALLALLSFPTPPGPNAGRPAVRPGAPPEPPRAEAPDPTHPVRLEQADGSSRFVASLDEALRLSAGLDGPTLVELFEGATTSLTVARPHVLDRPLTIRAAPGHRPALDLAFTAATSLIETKPAAALTLEGLTLRARRAGTWPGEPSVVDAAGPVTLRRCALVAEGGDRRLVAVRARGARVDLNGCWIRGFATGLRWEAAPGAEARIEQSILVGGSPSAGDEPGGWPLEIAVGAERGIGPRRLGLESATLVGAAGLKVVGASAAAPLQVQSGRSVVLGRWLLAWDGATFPAGLAWSGEGNLYDLGAPAWVAPSAQVAASTTPLGGGPNDLKRWAVAPVREAGSRAQALRFTGYPPGSADEPDDYVLMVGFAPPYPGAHPDRVAAPAP